MKTNQVDGSCHDRVCEPLWTAKDVASFLRRKRRALQVCLNTRGGQQLLTTPPGQLLTTTRADRWQGKDFRTVSRFRTEARRLRIAIP